MQRLWLITNVMLFLLLSGCLPQSDFKPLDGSAIASLSQAENETVLKATESIYVASWRYLGSPVEGCALEDVKNNISVCIFVSDEPFLETKIPAEPERVTVVFTTLSGMYECRNFGSLNNCVK